MPRVSNLVLIALLASFFTVAPFEATTTKASAVTATLRDTDALVFNRANGFTNIVGTGVAANDIVLYKKVGTFGGIEVDCAITTVSVSGSISNYDNPGSASTSAGYLNNFQMNTVGGAATLKFEFFQAGTYSGRNTGIPVVLQNVKITSIDIDSSGTTGYQYTDFTGFQKYNLMSPTNLSVTPLTNPNRVRFIAAKSGARSSVQEDQVLVKYDAIQTVQMTFGNVVSGSTNYFGLVFGGWPGASAPVEYSNVYNTPPTSTSTTLFVTNGAATTIPRSAFGTYADVDNNPFFQVRIASLPASGTLQFLNGSNWVNATTNQVISVSDLELGKLRYTGSSASSFTFSVHDGLDYSTSTYTITLAIAAAAQVITFNNPGAKSPTAPAFASDALSNSGLTVTLTSETTGVCTVSGLNITPVAAGTCVIIATQIGNASYSAAAPVSQTFPIDAKTPQTITFAKPVDRTFSDTPFSSGASTDASGLTVVLTSLTPTICTVSGLNIIMGSTGICQIRANQPGDGSRAPASPVEQTFIITPGPPAVVTTAATAVGSGAATLNGTVNTFGLATTSLYLCLGTSNSVTNRAMTCNTQNITITSKTSTSALAVSSAKTGLSNGTTYFYQLVAVTSGGTTYGDVVSFTPVAAPVVSSAVATTVQIFPGKTKTTKLKGSVNAGNTSRTVSYCWSDSPSLATIANTVVNVNGVLASCATSSGTYAVRAASSASISGSSTSNSETNDITVGEEKNYYYQVRITDGSDFIYGKILMFRTASTKAFTGNVTSITSSGGKLNGTGISGSSDKSASTQFCYSKTETVSRIGVLNQSLSTTKCVKGSPDSIESSSSEKAFSLTVSGLDSGETYFYQAIVTRTDKNYSFGEIKSFTTSSAGPVVTTAVASGIAGARATLNGAVVANALSSDNSFCWGTSSTLSGCTSVVGSPATSSGKVSTASSVTLEGLTNGTTYYFRAITQVSGASAVNGSILSFIAGSPLAITSSPSSVTTSSAVLNGAIKSNNLATTASFCFSSSSSIATTGALSSCTSVAATPSSVLAANTAPTAITATRSGLTSGNTYYYQAVATSGSRINYGAVVSFKAAGNPTATTDTVTVLTTNSVTLNGTLASNGDLAAGTFCLSSSDSQKEITGVLDTCLGGILIGVVTANTEAWSFEASKLKPGTRYYYQVIGENGIGTAYGNILNFRTLAGPPVVSTHSPSVYGTSAELNGEIESNGSNTNVSFCWGTDSNLAGCSTVTGTPSVVFETQTVAISVSTTITGLTSGTQYFYRAIGSNSATNGTVNGAILNFKAGTPTAITVAPSSVTGTTATLNGTVQTNGTDITAGNIKFCFITSSSEPLLETTGGLSDCYRASSPPITPVTATVPLAGSYPILGSDSSTVVASLNVTGLTAGETYYYQIVAENTQGFSYGEVVMFSAGVPVVTTTAPSSISTTSAVLTGSLNPSGDTASASICMSTTEEDTGGALTDCAQRTEVLTDATGTTATAMTKTVVGLSPATTYFYQASAVGTNGSPVGAILSFTTASAMVTFDKNDTSGITATQSSIVKTALTLQASLANFARTGFTFVSWNTSPNGVGGTSYTNGAEYLFDASTTLYAQWRADNAQTYTLTYNVNGSDSGSVPAAVVSYEANESVSILDNTNNLLKADFTFDGWYTTSSGTGGTAYAPFATILMPAQNLILYAKWLADAVAPPAPPAPAPPAPTPSPVVFQKITPAIVWKNPAPIRFRTLLSATQLNAIATLPTSVTAAILDPKTADQLSPTAPRLVGTYTYLPMTGQLLSVGLQKLNVTFTPLESGTYEVVSAVVEILVRDVPTLVWPAPAPIKRGTALGTTQLNALGSVPGTYKYVTPAGTILAPGKHKLKVVFTPTDPLFEPIEAEVEITVESIIINPQATPIVTPSDTKATQPVVNTTASVILSVVTVGRGLNGATTNGSSVSVDPTLGFSGKTEVLVKVLDQGEEKQITVPVTVLPLAVVAPLATPRDLGTTTIVWTPSPNATNYVVTVRGQIACETTAATCIAKELIGPATPVTVQAKGNDNTVAPVTQAAYKAPTKPVPAFVVNFATNSFALDAKAKTKIKAFAKILIKEGFTRVQIYGHTDIRGGVDNKVLSNNRATATLNYLKKLTPKIDSKLSGFAFGRPVASNKTQSGLAANRRAEVSIY